MATAAMKRSHDLSGSVRRDACARKNWYNPFDWYCGGRRLR